MESLKQELIERYQNTGKVGFTKPESDEEAYSLIATIVQLYNNEKDEEITQNIEDLSNVDEEQIEEVVLNLYDLTERFRKFFEKF